MRPRIYLMHFCSTINNITVPVQLGAGQAIAETHGSTSSLQAYTGINCTAIRHLRPYLTFVTSMQ